MKRTDTINVVFPAGKPAGTYTVKGILDSQYTRATGVVGYINSKPDSLPTFQLGLRNDSDVFIPPTNISHVLAGIDCPKPDRLTPVSIPCDNRNLQVNIILPVALDSELSLDVVFELVKEG
jgi:hypothetical protein